jgi:hypothetical protein
MAACSGDRRERQPLSVASADFLWPVIAEIWALRGGIDRGGSGNSRMRTGGRDSWVYLNLRPAILIS